jgi:hypothetical protein
MALNRSRAMRFFKESILISFLGVLLLGAIELVLRLMWPQTTRWDYVGGPPARRVDSTYYVLNENIVEHSSSPEFEVTYRTNSEGLRDKDISRIGQEIKGVRLLLLGDSFTFGAANDYENTWGYLLEEAVAKSEMEVDVVKAGVSGYGTVEVLRRLQELLPRYRPQAVVYGFLVNDLFDNSAQLDNLDQGNSTWIESRLSNGARQQEETARQKLEGIPGRLHSLALVKRLVLRSDALYMRLYASTSRSEWFQLPPTKACLRVFAFTSSLIDSMAALCARNGATLIVVSIPQFYQVIAGARGETGRDFRLNLVDSILSGKATANGISWLSTTESFAADYAAHGVDTHFRLDGHLTPYGNRLLSQVLCDNLLPLLRQEEKRRATSDVVPK